MYQIRICSNYLYTLRSKFICCTVEVENMVCDLAFLTIIAGCPGCDGLIVANILPVFLATLVVFDEMLFGSYTVIFCWSG